MNRVSPPRHTCLAPIAAIFLAWTLPACAQTTHPSIATTHPFKSVTCTDEVRLDPPMHLHVVTIDLTDPHVHVVVRPASTRPADGWETTLQTVQTIAQREGLAVAVNGDFFMSKESRQILDRKVPYFVGNSANVCGFAMSDGVLWSARGGEPSLVVDDKGRVKMGGIATLPPDARQIVSGSDMVVTLGKVTAAKADRAPRTLVGIDADAKKLTLLVVDGRRPEYSAGMTLAEAGTEMIKLGCHWALNLDGGGSSTLVVRDAASPRWFVRSYPSDGHDLFIPLSIQRPVASALGIKIDGVGAEPATKP